MNVFWNGLAAISFLILGISFIEKALDQIVGRAIKKVFLKVTNHPLAGIISGTIVTAILQSSSLVSLLLLAFIGGGVLPLKNALGVIIGANLGTTFTGWIVATLGLKVNLLGMGVPLIGIGILGYFLFTNKLKLNYWFLLMGGLGLLFYALGDLKGLFENIGTTFDVSQLKDLNIFLYFLFGIVFTAIIQSSSAMMTIVLVALDQKVIGLHGAAGLVIGADLGTTLTTFLGAIGGSPEKKRLAAGHIFFNFCIDVIALLFVYQLVDLAGHFFKEDDPLYALVFFHSSFNFFGIILFYPFLSKFSDFLDKLFVDKSKRKQKEFYPEHWQAAELQKETLLKELKEYYSLGRTLSLADIESDSFLKGYGYFKGREEYLYKVLDYVTKQESFDISEIGINNIYQFIENISFSLKSLKDIRHNVVEIGSNDQKLYKELEALLGAQSFDNFYSRLKTINEIEDEQSRKEELNHLISEVDSDLNEQMGQFRDYSSQSDRSTIFHICTEVSVFKKRMIRAFDCLNL
jgi:phosphate:Na+ symporter